MSSPPPDSDTGERLITLGQAVRGALGVERFEELRERAKALRGLPERLIFTVTSGRSGTGALAHILGGFRGLTAKHEARPSFAEALRAVNQAQGLALEFWVRRKLPAIAKTQGSTYIETSHLACLGFLEQLELLGLPLELLLLRRPARAVALSLWRLDTIPGRSLRGHRYYLSPRDPCLLRMPAACLDELHDYQLCYWYTQEIEARQEQWQQRASQSGPKVMTLETADLEGPEAIFKVGRILNLGPRRFAIDAIRGLLAPRHRNDKSASKRERHLSEAELTDLELGVSELWRAGEEECADHSKM